MNRYAWIAFATAVVVPMFSATATDPYPIDPVSEITSRWADAARGVKSLHAEIIRYEYDDTFHVVRKSEGTVDFERPNRCRLELRPMDQSQEPAKVGGSEYEPIGGDALTIVWSDKALTFIHPDERSYDLIPIAPGRPAVVQQVTDASTDAKWFEDARALYAGDSFWELLVGFVQRTSAATNQILHDWSLYASPSKLLPILPSDPDSVRKQGYELVQLSDFKKGLSARPNSNTANRGIIRIDILFDAETGLPRATRQVTHHRSIVHVLKNVKLNPDVKRSDLFEPNLEGLTAAFVGRTPTETKK